VSDLVKVAGAQIRQLRRNKFDVAIDFQGLLKSAVIARLSGAKRVAGFERAGLREPASRIFLTQAAGVASRAHVIDKNLALAGAALGHQLKTDKLRFPIATGADHVAESEDVTKKTGGRFALINPAGGWVTKLWPAENFGHLAARIEKELGLAAVVSTGPGEVELESRVRNAAATDNVLFVQPSLKGFYEIARRASIYVGGDTGPTHLAIAAGAPVVGLFGPTEWWRNGSLASGDICVERTDIACRINCHRRQCSNWICMDFDTERVFSAVIARLAAEPAGKVLR
jgi:ADP-heptose:LPS heptosyltransferase